MLNMDMIGWSLGELLVGGVGTALEFRKVLETAQEQSDLHFRFAETPRASSDHMAFSHHEIPVLSSSFQVCMQTIIALETTGKGSSWTGRWKWFAS